MEKDTKLTESNLRMFTGTQGYLRFSPILFHDFLLTDGCKYVAEKGEAFWLFDAIASHQSNPKLKKGRLHDMQFWTLTVTGGKGVLECRADTNVPPAIVQNFSTDFPLNEIKFYVQPDGRGHLVCMLPSEY